MIGANVEMSIIPVNIYTRIINSGRDSRDLNTRKLAALIKSPCGKNILITTLSIGQQQLLPPVMVGGKKVQHAISIRIHNSGVIYPMTLFQG